MNLESELETLPSAVVLLDQFELVLGKRCALPPCKAPSVVL